MASAARKSRPPIDIEDDGPVLRPDLSDLFHSPEPEPKADDDTLSALFGEPAEQTPVQEGTPSGLIDIRSLASAYREMGVAEARPANEDIELPAPPIESPKLPGLLIKPSQEPPRRSRMTRLGLMVAAGVLTVAATAAATTFVVTRRSSAPVAERQASAPAAQAVAPQQTMPRREPVAARPAVETGTPAAPVAVAEIPEPAEQATTEDTTEVAKAKPEPERKTTHEAGEVAPPRREHSSARAASKDEDQEADEVVLAPVATPAPKTSPAPAEAKPAAAPAPAKNAKASNEESYDDVDCLLHPTRAGCRSEDNAAGGHDASDANLPDHLERSAIESGLRPVHGRLMACGDRHSVSGVANLVVTIDRNGKVTRGRTTAGTPDFQSCVSSVLSKAHFSRTKNGQTFRFPLILR